VDTEFTSDGGLILELVQIGVRGTDHNGKAWGHAYVFNIHACPDLAAAGSTLAKVLQNSVPKVFHDASSDIKALAGVGIKPDGVRDTFDVMAELVAPLLGPEEAGSVRFTLPLDLLFKQLGLPGNARSPRFQRNKAFKPWQNLFSAGHYPPWMIEYAAADVFALPRVWEKLTGESTAAVAGCPDRW